jgi:hypothetical protein
MVADAFHGLDAIVGPDPRDIFTLTKDWKQEVNYASYLRTKEALGVPSLAC